MYFNLQASHKRSVRKIYMRQLLKIPVWRKVTSEKSIFGS